MEPIIKSLLDTDLYKITMNKAVLECFPGTPVIYQFLNRNPQFTFSDDFLQQLRRQIDGMSRLRLQNDEYDFLAERCPFIGEPYLKWLKDYRFDPAEVLATVVDGQLNLTIQGKWERTILWEVPLMALISECYFHDNPQPNSIEQKGQALADAQVVFTDFGTRRRRSFAMQDLVVRTLVNYKGFMGTSNVLLAKQYQTRPLGTMAHEWISGVSALEGLQHANRYAMMHWCRAYKGNLGTALADTFGSAAFWEDFDSYYARLFDSVRQDSGDPFQFGDDAIEHYKKLGINPMHKYILFSDALTVDKAIQINKYFAGRVNTSFGIGTHFTNDVPGSPALNMVIKMVSCDNIPVVKLSDVPSKAIGARDAIRVARWTFFKEPLDG